MIKKRVKAFSLIEVGIVLLILGALGSFFTSFLDSTKSFYEKKTNQKKQSFIAKSLAGYVLQNRCLPGASLPTNQGSSVPDTYIGIVPYKELNLDPKSVKDGNGFWYTYAVHPTLTKTCIKHQREKDMFVNADFCNTKLDHSSLKIKDQYLQEDGIAFVLVTHHKGNGSISDNDQRNLSCFSGSIEGSLEKLNASDTGEFSSTNVKDIVSWFSRFNFMAQITKTPCQKEDFQEKKTPREKLPDTFEESF